MVFHGVDGLKDGRHPLTGALRYNLTFRSAL
jgi:alkylated DNA repair protein (DNA oxidative demethylase)